MTCPYCGLDPVGPEHIQSRHGISPERHAELTGQAVPDFASLGAPAGTILEVTRGPIPRVRVVDPHHGGYL
jgi:hypothetical protein